MITKVAIDQLCYTPIAIGLFYETLNTLEGRPLDLPATMQVGPKPSDRVRPLFQACMSSYNHGSNSPVHRREAEWSLLDYSVS